MRLLAFSLTNENCIVARGACMYNTHSIQFPIVLTFKRLYVLHLIKFGRGNFISYEFK